MEHTSLSVFDYSGKKVCDLYDSAVSTAGQAFDISVTTELSASDRNNPANVNKVPTTDKVVNFSCNTITDVKTVITGTI